MASRKTQKEEARARRLAEEQATALKARRTRRLQMVGGTVAAVIVVVVVLVVISVSGSSNSNHAAKAGSAKATTTTAAVDQLLKGIPQSGTTLGQKSAPVTVTEYGDLECPICRDFALSAENELISKDVRSGKVKLVYASFPTATANGPDPSVFPVQQSAAYAAGAQNKGWNYIETFYKEQGTEDTAYVTTSFLTNIAKQVSGLDLSTWASQRFNPKYTNQVAAEEKTAEGLGIDATPSFVVSSKSKQSKPASGDFTYAQMEKLIQSVQ